MTAMGTLPWGRAIDADEFAGLDVPDDGRRYELVDGVLIVSPSPLVQPQRVVRQITTALAAACPDELEVFGAPLEVRLSDRTVVERDVLVVRTEDARGRRLVGVPLPASCGTFRAARESRVGRSAQPGRTSTRVSSHTARVLRASVPARGCCRCAGTVAPEPRPVAVGAAQGHAADGHTSTPAPPTTDVQEDPWHSTTR